MIEGNTTDSSENHYIFNYLPNRYLHRTWWQSLEYGRELALLAGFERTETRVANIILKNFNLNNCYQQEFDSSLEKLMLLTEADLCRLANHLGLCLTYQNISDSILKAKKEEYKQALGEEAYFFANNAAKVLCEANNITETYPIKKAGILVQNHTIGLCVLGKALLNADRALKYRLILKLGKPYEKFILGTSSFSPLSASELDCISLVEAVAQYLGFISNSEQQTEINIDDANTH